MAPFNITTCARPNILALQPYNCARDDYTVDETNVLLDLNENAFGPSLPSDVTARATDLQNSGVAHLHRYPDRLQRNLKHQLCKLRNDKIPTDRNLTSHNVFIGSGSVEALDALIRCFCRPGHDCILTCPPTYGMYGVSAQVNDVRNHEVPLLPAPTFGLDVPAINHALLKDETIKLAYFASPGNPTGSLLSRIDIERILAHPSWNGVVVLDEAYIDFVHEDASLAALVTQYPNLVVVQTLSKAFGLAGIRVGVAFASPPVAHLLNNLKAPWNTPSPSSALASLAISEEGQFLMRHNRALMKAQRNRMLEELPKINGVGRLRGGTDSNFLLFEMLNTRGEPDNAVAAVVYDRLAKTSRVVVRFRGKEPGCFGCLRITVGTEDETTSFLESLRKIFVAMRQDAGARRKMESHDCVDDGVNNSSPSLSSLSLERSTKFLCTNEPRAAVKG
ncbi:MAG: histidinol-phosphate transaminase [Chrysothrix sp. TS-e1954]|nr:MAG: histidinol-phosphate transaminase [Chrysothrix sp. TS-e1954]